MQAEIVYSSRAASSLDDVLAAWPATSNAGVPFSGEAIEFCDRLSTAVSRSAAARQHPELQALAFSIRRAETRRLHAQFKELDSEEVIVRPRGCVVHFAPANVDTVFAYSWIWSALVGNRNIVRLSSRRSTVSRKLEAIVCEQLREAPDSIRTGTLIVGYDHDDIQVTARLSAQADVRLIFGGDGTVQAIKSVRAKPQTVDIGFVDRLSVAILCARAVTDLDASGLQDLAARFARDLCLDQGTCSSPRTVIWVGHDREISVAARRLWRALDEELARRNDAVPPGAAISKMVAAATLAAGGRVRECTTLSNRLTVVTLSGMTGLEDPGVGSGFFQEVHRDALENVAALLDRRVQTATVFGWCGRELREFVSDPRLIGVDRLVPIGDALSFGRYWDGFDLLRTLTRSVAIPAIRD